ncbi:MAG: ribonuclease III [Rikenellaceae bacterium]
MIYDMFGFVPHNIDLYKLAFIHKSASLVLEDGTHINNERLEFLGDAIIEAVTSDFLYIEYPTNNEGLLTQLRSKIVSRQSLNRVAKAIGLDGYVISNANCNFSHKNIYGDAFEAIMGAIYLDMGYDVVNRLLINDIYPSFINLDSLLVAETDFKSRLIEWTQKEHHTIEFITELDKESTPTHPLFYSKVMIAGVEVGHGVGDSKKEAEQRAAQSVSEGVSDKASDELLDKIDTLESQSAEE